MSEKTTKFYRDKLGRSWSMVADAGIKVQCYRLNCTKLARFILTMPKRYPSRTEYFCPQCSENMIQVRGFTQVHETKDDY